MLIYYLNKYLVNVLHVSEKAHEILIRQANVPDCWWVHSKQERDSDLSK